MARISNVSTDEADTIHKAASALNHPAVSSEVEAPKKTFAQSLAEEAGQINREKDAAGRVIGVKRLTFIETHKITLTMGENSSNSTALTQAMLTAAVCEIDGEAIRFPNTQLQIEAMMTRLDFHGIAAANKAHSRFVSVSTDGDQEIKN
jgi:translation initiation factor 2B subunit (eIF-2B alpha/beta/delta family)